MRLPLAAVTVCAVLGAAVTTAPAALLYGARLCAAAQDCTVPPVLTAFLPADIPVKLLVADPVITVAGGEGPHPAGWSVPAPAPLGAGGHAFAHGLSGPRADIAEAAPQNGRAARVALGGAPPRSFAAAAPAREVFSGAPVSEIPASDAPVSEGPIPAGPFPVAAEPAFSYPAASPGQPPQPGGAVVPVALTPGAGGPAIEVFLPGPGGDPGIGDTPLRPDEVFEYADGPDAAGPSCAALGTCAAPGADGPAAPSAAAPSNTGPSDTGPTGPSPSVAAPAAVPAPSGLLLMLAGLAALHRCRRRASRRR